MTKITALEPLDKFENFILKDKSVKICQKCFEKHHRNVKLAKLQHENTTKINADSVRRFLKFDEVYLYYIQIFIDQHFSFLDDIPTTQS